LVPHCLNEQIEMLIDELIEDGNVATASLASIFMAAQAAVAGGYDVALCRHVWMASRDFETSLKKGPLRHDTSELLDPICQS
jgi:hypothetical protein